MAGLGVLALWQPALAAGVFVDVAGELAFLTAPQRRALSGRLVSSNGTETDASIYVLDARFPRRSYALIELHLPYVVTTQETGLEYGLGDLLIRARARLYQSPKRILHLLCTFRTGSGTSRVFPYASQSNDLDFAIGYVDTLELFDLWASMGGAYVGRAPESLPEDELHGHFGHVGAGIGIRATSGVTVGFSLSVAFFEGGRSREIYLGTLDYQRSQWLALTISAHVEGSKREERVSDSAVAAGIRVFY
ncbi:MAG: hypothetical protein KAJ17_13115 [Candidatus Krumholzibacteria bacterium]|nr:hypothetical protein [Candidatus Krumholzibacteria bacterium]